MKKKKTLENTIFIGFGIITILSGIYLVFQDQLLIGISGSIVGIWLTVTNMKAIKDKNIE